MKDGSPLAPFAKSIPIVMVMVNAADGTSADTLKANLEKSMDKYIIFQVLSPQDLAGQSAQMVDGMLNTLYALLALAIIIAVLGIINTLALNVIERRQEIGMLRAVGTYRGQVRRMITLEAVQIAVYGALVGVLVGLGLGWCFIRVLQGTGLDEIAVPWVQVAAMMAGRGGRCSGRTVACSQGCTYRAAGGHYRLTGHPSGVAVQPTEQLIFLRPQACATLVKAFGLFLTHTSVTHGLAVTHGTCTSEIDCVRGLQWNA